MKASGASREGAVLVVVLWIVFILAVLALGIKAHVDRHIQGAFHISQREAARILARNGVEISRWQIQSDTNDWDAAVEAWGLGYEQRFESGVCRVKARDETARLNVNTAHPEWITRLLIAATENRVQGPEEITAAILDWRDDNDDVTPGGAESDQYLRTHGYPVRNGRMTSEYELKLIRGVEEDVFEKIRPYVTAHGVGRLNLNTADELLLQTLAESVSGDESDAVPALIERIERFRDDEGVFKSTHWPDVVAELSDGAEMPESEILVLRRMAVSFTVTSRFFRVISSGDVGADGTVDAAVECVVDRSNGAIVFWHEE